MTDALQIFKCLADTSRLQILSGLLREPMYVELIAQRLALAPSTVSFHLKKLEAAGLVTSHKDQYYTMYTLNAELLDQPLRALLPPVREEESIEAQREAAYRQKVIDAFFVYGKLKVVPAQHKKRVIILEEIAKRFTPGVKYPEREVNLIISEMNDDFCTLRRELIVEGLMERDHNVYWLKENKIDPQGGARD